MKFRWHEAALAETDAAAAFYESKQLGLALSFLDSVEESLRRISRHPLAYRQVEGELRKCRVPRFPFGIVYRVRPEFIEIIAVMHLRRAPGYWRERR